MRDESLSDLMKGEEMKEHDGCKGCRYEKESIDSNNCIGCVQNAIDKYSKMTNYDMIKNMSVDEMARTLHIISRENGRNINKNINNCNCLTADFLKWLNSESEVENE